MANDLVKFPSPGDEWEEVHGPGMYVLAVLPRNPEPDPCAVGCAILLLRPKGKLLTQTDHLWDPDDDRDHDAELIEEAARLFEKRGEAAKAAVMRAQFPVVGDLSVEVIQATRMGATDRTLKNRKTGEYWQAQWDDLTPSGVLHLHQIHTGFMRAPLILTFLGDDE